MVDVKDPRQLDRLFLSPLTGLSLGDAHPRPKGGGSEDETTRGVDLPLLRRFWGGDVDSRRGEPFRP